VRALAGCSIWFSGGGSGLHGHAGERRLPRSGSPPESWDLDDQRPTIHRLYRCRGPRGPRASVTLAGYHASIFQPGGPRWRAHQAPSGVTGAPRRTLLTPSDASGTQAGRPAAHMVNGSGGRLSPRLKCGRLRGSNTTRHSKTTVQAGKLCWRATHVGRLRVLARAG
jgi:hypothetical protein